MIGVELYEGWKLLVADLFNPVATRRKRTAGFEVSDVGRQSGDLVELALFCCWIGYGAKQTFRVWITWSRKQFGRSSLFEDLSCVHHDHVIGHAGDDAEIVSDQDNAGARFAFERLYEFEYLSLNGDVESGCWLVGDQEFRFTRKRHRDHHALAHAA